MAPAADLYTHTASENAGAAVRPDFVHLYIIMYCILIANIITTIV